MSIVTLKVSKKNVYESLIKNVLNKGIIEISPILIKHVVANYSFSVTTLLKKLTKHVRQLIKR